MKRIYKLTCQVLLVITTLLATDSCIAQGSVASNGLSFDGNDDRAEIPSGIVLSNRSFTIEFWAKRNQTGRADWILVQDDDDSGFPNHTLHIGFRDNDRLVFGFWSADTEAIPGSTANYDVDTDWHHYAFVQEVEYNPDFEIGHPLAETTTSQIYQDGELLVQESGRTYAGVGANIVLGKFFAENQSLYQGSLDELRIWDTARTAVEISDNINKSNLKHNSLLAYYPMNECSFDGILQDRVGTRDAVLHNGLALTSGQSHNSGRIYVNASRPDNSRDGMSWATAYRDLQNALDHAQWQCDAEVWVAKGTYLPTESPDGTTTDPRDRAFHFSEDIKVYGGFVGTETMLSQRNVVTNATTLSGDFNGDDVVTGGGSTLSITNNSENAYHVMITTGLTNAAVVDGFTIRGGNADGSNSMSYESKTFWKDNCGGMYNFTSSPTITKVTISFNSSSSVGGGMVNDNTSSPTITNVTINSNSSGDSGGGMFNNDSSPTITNVTISSNSSGSAGGGMYNDSSSPTITNVTISSNSSGSAGGGMYNDSSSPTITNVTFSNNSARFSGGGMDNLNGSSPTLYNTVLYGNTVNGSPDDISGDNINASSSHNASDVTGSNISGGTGFVTLTSDPFINSSDPNGADNIWGTADDGLIPKGTLPSPLVNVGIDAQNTLTTDIAGNSRKFGAIDIGAYEFQGVPMLACKAATTLYVNHDATGANTGESWANAFKDLQDALDCADAGEEIWVAKGTYLPTESPDGTTTDARDRSFHFSEDIKVYGGFSGTETMLSQRNVVTNVTTLSGDFDGNDSPTEEGYNGNDEQNAYHVLITTGLTNAGVIDGFTIRGGNASGNSTISYNSEDFFSGYGGGMFNSSSSPTLTNVTFSNNTGRSGAGMYNALSSNPNLTNLFFSNNNAGSYGGGMFNSSSSPTLTNVRFSNNYTGDSGGGMFNNSSSPTFTNVTFSNNTGDSGGGMFNESSSPTLTNVTFSNNNTERQGGGMFNRSSSPTLTNVTFSNNQSKRTGGGMYNDFSSNPTLTKVIFSKNFAETSGGGMFNFSSSPNLTNVSFRNNMVNYQGGGMYNGFSSSPTLVNVTFSKNVAESLGGGMYNDLSSPTLFNTVFYRNSLFNVSNDIFGDNISSASSHNASDGTGGNISTGTGFVILDTDPFTNSSDPDGADNIWGTADDGLIPSASSPLVDAGTDAQNSETTDIAGQTRKVRTIDIGAYEFQGSPAKAPVFENSTPSVTGITTGMFFLNVDIDQAGTIYYVILADNATVPTGTEVKSGTGASGSSVVKSGNGIVNSGNFSITFFIDGFSPATAYDVYVVAESSNGMLLQSSATKVDVTTDRSIPEFINNTPDTYDIGEEGFSLSVQTDRNGTIYYVVLDQGASSPSSEDVRDGNDGGGYSAVASGSEEGMLADFTITDLYPSTMYDVFVVAEDNLVPANLQEDPYQLSVTTLDPPACTTASILYVTTTGAGTKDGTSWGDAMDDLQAAMDCASVGTEIWVAAGTYRPTESPDGSVSDPRNRAFHFNKDLKLYGGFAGTETMLSQRNLIANQTTLSGDLDGNDMFLFDNVQLDYDEDQGEATLVHNGYQNNTGDDNAYNILVTVNLSSSQETIIDGFTLQGSNSHGNTAPIMYDGLSIGDDEETQAHVMYNAHNMTIKNCTYKDNYGAGYSIYSNDVRIEQSTMVNNFTAGNIFRISSCNNIRLNECSLTDNFGSSTVLKIKESSSPSISNCNFHNNVCNALLLSLQRSDYPILTSCAFLDNESTNGDILYLFDSDNSITQNCVFARNRTARSVGHNRLLVNPLFINCIFYENKNDGNAQAFLNVSVTGMKVYNSIIWDNDNEILNSSNTNPTFSHCIIKGSDTSPAKGDDGYENKNAFNWNANYGTDGGGNIDEDPQFVDASNNNFQLQPTSPGINAGTDVGVTLPSTDIMGNPRTFSTVDIGAYENQTILPVELLDFTAQKEQDQVLLSWLTASESYNERFEIEHSTDAVIFDKIGERAGSVYSNALLSYDYVHWTPTAGDNYYRLKQVDYDGAYSYSPIILVEMEGALNDLRIYPNPVANTLHILNGKGQIELVNTLGYTVKQYTLSGNQDELDVRSLVPGTYFLKLIDGNKQIAVQRFIKM